MPKNVETRFFLHSALKGLYPIASYTTEKQAGWNAVQLREMNPALGFVKIVELPATTQELSLEEKAKFQLPAEMPVAW